MMAFLSGITTQGSQSSAPHLVCAGGRPHPFVKWAGGKGQLLQALLDRAPAQFSAYYEPFLGGGALFFGLSRAGRLDGKKIFLSDVNQELIGAFVVVRDDLAALCQLLTRMPYDKTFYYTERAKNPASLSDVERAARFIYLNRAGFNGLYRVNSSGRFNVPFGRHSNPTILDAQNLSAVSKSLQGVNLSVADFAAAVSTAGPDDFVYFDPVYYPITKTAKFTNYTSAGFGMAEHQRLATLVHGLGTRRVKALLSNSDTPVTRELYAGLNVETVQAVRTINSNANRRGSVSELLVRNY